ncbi:MAG: signal peptide peptidase SppA [Planctomycetota bacterium]|jgi:protease-4
MKPTFAASLIALLIFATPILAQDATSEATPVKPALKDAKAPAKKPEAANEALIAEIKVKIANSEDPFAEMPFGPSRLNYLGFLNEVREAARDPEIDGVVLKLDSYQVGWARVVELRDALLELRKSGKKVFLYKENYTTADLVFAAAADRVSMPETGIVMLPGLAIEMMYLKGLLDKLHIKFDVIHIGEFKTAGESMVRETMSDAQKRSLDPILDEFYETMVKSIADGRGLTTDQVKKLIDQGIFYGAAAKKAGLVDRIEYYDQFVAGMKAVFPGKTLKKSKKYGPGKGAQFDPNNPIAAIQILMTAFMGGAKKPREAGPRVAVIYCTGAITSGKSQYDWTGNISSMGSKTIVKAIDKARKDDEVKAIVLRVNSPGGSALASDMIWRAVARAKEKKPVIASMGDVAASGGYYISMNSDAIFAEPQTITGSIGVVGMVPNLDEFFPWVGISMQRMTRGKRAAAFLTSKSLGPEDKEVLRGTMKSLYGDFVAKVAAGRGKTPAEIEPLARGRVWTGRDALGHGLVDKLGGLREAIVFAREKAGLKADEKVHLMELPRRGGPFEALEKMFGGAEVAGMDGTLDWEILKRVPEIRRALQKIATYRRISADGIAMLNPELDAFMLPAGGSAR